MVKPFDPTRDLYDAPEPTQESTLELSAGQKSDFLGAAEVESPPTPAKPTQRHSGSGGYIPDPASSISRAPAIRYPSSSRNRYGIHSVAIRENIAPKEHIRIYGNLGPLTTIFVLGIVVAILAIGLASRSLVIQPVSPPQEPGYLPQSGPTVTTTDAVPESGSLVEPVFGPFAVRQCVNRCQTRTAPASESCARGCAMYHLSVYGRRISFDRYDPAADVEEIVNRCTKRDFEIASHTSGSLWEEETGAALQLLDESADIYRHADLNLLHSHYLQLLDATKALRIAPGATAVEVGMTRDLARSMCLDANYALTSLALTGAMQAGDTVSERYYRRIAQSLEPKVAEMTTKATMAANTLKLR